MDLYTPPLTLDTLNLDDHMSFDSYCIVCDRLIVPAKEPECKKKLGTIRVKNPDGSTTTRSATGQKTRPGIKRNPTSRSKLQPLTRTTSDEFKSTIYCSKGCADLDAGRSNTSYDAIARKLSYNMEYPPSPLEMQHTGRDNAFAPPSPLFISESDTESSAASAVNNGLQASSAASAPKMEYFRMTRDNPDDAWREIERQRRSSMQHPPRPMFMTRQKSQSSGSSDSLNSLWQDDLVRPGLRMTRTSFSSEIRSNLSQTSLTSPLAKSIPIPPEFGSAPDHTLSLFQTYAAAFPVRESCGRRGSTCSTNGIKPSVSGTIKAKPTWDALGRDALNLKASREHESTPKQSQPHSVQSGWDIESSSYTQSRAIPIRPHPLLSTSSTSTARTPLASSRGMPPPAPFRPASVMPPMVQRPLFEPKAGSAPKPGWNWDELEKKGGKTYALPKGIVPSRSGLFYFQ